jgi:hypothetical protein
MVLNRIVTAEYPRVAMLARLPPERNVNIQSAVRNPKCPLVHGDLGGDFPRGEITQYACLFHAGFSWSLWNCGHSTIRLVGAPLARRIRTGQSAHQGSERWPTRRVRRARGRGPK